MRSLAASLLSLLYVSSSLVSASNPVDVAFSIENQSNFCMIPSNLVSVEAMGFRTVVNVAPLFPAWLPAGNTTSHIIHNLWGYKFDLAVLDCNTRIPQATYTIDYSGNQGGTAHIKTISINPGVNIFLTSGGNFYPIQHKTILSNVANQAVPKPVRGTIRFYSDAQCSDNQEVYRFQDSTDGKFIVNGKSFKSQDVSFPDPQNFWGNGMGVMWYNGPESWKDLYIHTDCQLFDKTKGWTFEVQKPTVLKKTKVMSYKFFPILDQAVQAKTNDAEWEDAEGETETESKSQFEVSQNEDENEQEEVEQPEEKLQSIFGRLKRLISELKSM